VIGILSITKSTTALSELSKKQAESVASDLAGLADQILKEEVKLAEVFAADDKVLNVVSLLHQQGADAVTGEISELYKSLGKQVSRLGSSYEGVFVSDAKGNLFTGVLEDGKEYKGSNINDRDYFQTAKSIGKTTIGEVIRLKVTGNLVTAICVPIKSETGEFVGALGLVMKVEFLAELIYGRKIGKTGYGFMTNNKGIVLAHPVTKHILSTDMTSLVGMEEIVRRMLAGEQGVEEYNFNGVDKIAGFAPLSMANWYIAATQDESEFLMAAHSIRNASIIITLLAIALTGSSVASKSDQYYYPLPGLAWKFRAIVHSGYRLRNTNGDTTTNF